MVQPIYRVPPTLAPAPLKHAKIFRTAEQESAAAKAVYDWIVEEHFRPKWERESDREDPETDFLDIYEEGLRLSVAKFRTKSKTRKSMLVSYRKHGKFTLRVTAIYNGQYIVGYRFDHISGHDEFVREFLPLIWPDYAPVPDERLVPKSAAAAKAKQTRKRRKEPNSK
jgi:hypothetical protein